MRKVVIYPSMSKSRFSLTVIYVTSVLTDDVLEIMSVKLSLNKKHNIIVNGTYEARGTNVDKFTNKVEVTI